MTAALYHFKANRTEPMVAEDQISIDIFLICPEHFVPPFMEYVYVVGFGPLALAVEVLSYIRQLFRRKRNVNS